jgi:type 2 lantibiotic biosynthesis protein LanM
LQQIAARGDDVENKQNKIDLNPAHPKALSFGQWALALSLKERAELIGRSRFADKPLLQNFNRAERWQRTPAFQTPSNWTHFLGAAGLSEAILENTLSARAELLQDHSSAPDWVTEITASCEEVGDEHSTIDLSDTAGFLRLVEPILKQYTECLADAVRVFNSDFAGEVIDRRVVSDLADNLREQLLAVIARPLIVEVNIARLQNSLEGANSHERYINFVRKLSIPSFRMHIWNLYPVMARYCLKLCAQWLDAAKEFLSRLKTDRNLLITAFGQAATGKVIGMQCAPGETHLGGRRVLVAIFEDDFRIVYKPRSQTAASRFQDILIFLNERGQEPAFRPLIMLDRHAYGWMEFVYSSDCSTELEVKRFYQRQGASLAVLYIFGGIDCHFENIIAAGEHPALIDIETVFHPRMSSLEDKDLSSDQIGQRILSESVLAVGLLPRPTISGDKTLDMSGIGAASFQETPLETTGLIDVGMDTVSMRRVPFTLDEIRSRPKLQGSDVEIAQYAHDVLRGFEETYLLLQKHRGELLAKDSILDKLVGIPIRILIRPTAAYSGLLNESLHPHCLHDELERERVLAQIWSGSDRHPLLRGVVQSEYAHLFRGDVPYFRCAPDEAAIQLDDFGVAEQQPFTPGLWLIREKIQQMGRHDLARQQRLIKLSLPSVAQAQSNPSIIHSARHDKPDCLELARGIADEIADLAIRSGDTSSWLSFENLEPHLPGKNCRPCIVSTPLYDGIAGIALFLGYLGHCLQSAEHVSLARSALGTLNLRVSEQKSSLGIGAFDGLGGILYAYSHLGVLWKDDELIDRALDLLPDLESAIALDEKCDLISGFAGAILCLLSLHAARPSSLAMDLANVSARHILDAIKDTDGERDQSDIGLRYSRGASHGWSGITLALCKLSSASKFDRVSARELATVLHLEHRLTRDNKWIDPNDPDRISQATWCHGAPGIALCRLGANTCRDVGTDELEVEAALRETISSYQPLVAYGLCHGELGVAESFLAASLYLRKDPWERIARGHMDAIVTRVTTEGWRHDGIVDSNSPGLMTGLSGVGYELLRFHAPHVVPSVLLLEPPNVGQ